MHTAVQTARSHAPAGQGAVQLLELFNSMMFLSVVPAAPTWQPQPMLQQQTAPQLMLMLADRLLAVYAFPVSCSLPGPGDRVTRVKAWSAFSFQLNSFALLPFIPVTAPGTGTAVMQGYPTLVWAFCMC